MPDADLSIGLRGTALLIVSAEHTAEALGSGNVPVFGTPRLVALVEQAAVNAIGNRLAPGETSVGTRIEISHLAATPIGQEVRAEARLAVVDGRRMTFEVVAYDAQEKIAEGTHDRVVIDEQRFLGRVRRKSRGGEGTSGREST
jgi:predicted thioesterase